MTTQSAMGIFFNVTVNRKDRHEWLTLTALMYKNNVVMTTNQEQRTGMSGQH